MRTILKKLAVRLDELLGGLVLVSNPMYPLMLTRRTLRCWRTAA